MPDKINLLMLTHNYPRFAGDYAGVFIALLAKRLQAHGVRAVILAPHHPGAAEEETAEGVKIYRFRYGTDEEETLAYRGNMHQLVLGSIDGALTFRHFLDCFRKKAAELIEKEQINICAGHWLIPSGLVMKTLARKYDLPMIISSHGTDIRLMKRYYRVVYRYLRKFCYGLKSWTVVSNFLREGLLEIDPRLEGIVTVLPLPHNEEVFYREDSAQKEENLILAVTRFTDQKRVEFLIKAFALVSEQRPQARLHIYGSGPLKEDIVHLIVRFGLEKKVEITEPVTQSELRRSYNRATMVVLNSVDEGFGLALSEGMLCGTAAIGADSGGIRDIIKHERTGLLVPPDNPPMLAQAVVRLLDDKKLRTELAEAGYRYSRETYSSTMLAAKFALIIRNALTPPGSRLLQ